MKNKSQIILAIETSCDETAICIAQTNKDNFKIISNIVFSQIKIHAPFGGVVPSLAKREHQKNLIPLLKLALKEAGLFNNREPSFTKASEGKKIKMLNTILERDDILLKKILPFLKKHKKPSIDLIAVTYGPGLAPALWPGVNLARALSFYWNIPLVPINHLEAHILANWLPNSPSFASSLSLRATEGKKNLFPAVCSVISGGHTLIVLMKKIGQYKIIGETRDDAAGECFDKSARLLGLGYPGGPAISQQAEIWKSQFPISNFKSNFKLPRPMINTKDFDFSFSGLKTAVLYLVQDLKKQGKNIKKLTPALCYEIQEAINETLVKKTLSAAKKYKAKSIILGGGVIANQALRDKFIQIIKRDLPKVNFLTPERKFTTDNAAMIAIVAHLNKKIIRQMAPACRRAGTRPGREWTNWKNLQVNANLKF